MESSLQRVAFVIFMVQTLAQVKDKSDKGSSRFTCCCRYYASQCDFLVCRLLLYLKTTLCACTHCIKHDGGRSFVFIDKNAEFDLLLCDDAMPIH